MTEADLLLVTRPSALPAIVEELQKKHVILSAHRLQPLPHEMNLPGYTIENDIYRPVISTESCCDGGQFKPGFRPVIRPCGYVWSYCGFNKPGNYSDPAVFQEKHKRLKDYAFISLTRGSGLVFAGTNHGRRCFPKHNNNEACKKQDENRSDTMSYVLEQ
eukprot:CAMPEP_0178935088 /NCGR_PEP_ID=MMETSP0786-20121207/24300_1 /TAXON_ID=186022 /ORGANISM="Thalassionema frauenfeldii, Strain CCMP 1798" /LENGTH=159 /DNA_ID=CAMNT_0020613095 /DNA_START=37 /DNA_END=517 /DNA_ORIENTATION=-